MVSTVDDQLVFGIFVLKIMGNDTIEFVVIAYLENETKEEIVRISKLYPGSNKIKADI